MTVADNICYQSLLRLKGGLLHQALGYGCDREQAGN